MEVVSYWLLVADWGRLMSGRGIEGGAARGMKRNNRNYNKPSLAPLYERDRCCRWLEVPIITMSKCIEFPCHMKFSLGVSTTNPSQHFSVTLI